MKLRLKEVGEGLHPRERMAEIKTSEGPEYLILDEQTVKGGSIEVGFPVRVRNGDYLIELPRETVRGAWRVWVPRSEVIEAEARVA
jgi:hypothetical protein